MTAGPIDQLETFDLRPYVRAVARQPVLVLLTVIACSAASIVLLSRSGPIFETSGRLQITDFQSLNNALPAANPRLDVALLLSIGIARETAAMEKVALSALPTLNAKIIEGTSLVQISLQAGDAATAKRIAGTYVSNYLKQRQAIVRAELRERRSLSRQSLTGISDQIRRTEALLVATSATASSSLEAKLSSYYDRRIVLEEALRSFDASEHRAPATLSELSSIEKTGRSRLVALLLGAIAGLVLSAAAAIARSVLRDRIFDTVDVAAALPGVPVLAEVDRARSVPDRFGEATSAIAHVLSKRFPEARSVSVMGFESQAAASAVVERLRSDVSRCDFSSGSFPSPEANNTTPDASVIVVQSGTCRRRALVSAACRLDALDVRIVGIVLYDVRKGDRNAAARIRTTIPRD